MLIEKGGVTSPKGFKAASGYAGIGDDPEKGDMALIGPRPLLVQYLPYYTEREQLRHTVRPGISGWAQVHGRNTTKWDDRLEYDAYYAENLTLMMDLKIIFMTIKNVLQRKDVSVDSTLVESYLDEERQGII